MSYYHFIWTDEIVAHLAENRVTPPEFEEVLAHPNWVGRSRSSGNRAAVGQTRAGRRLFVTYERIDPTTIVPVTAYDI